MAAWQRDAGVTALIAGAGLDDDQASDLTGDPLRH
jgi:hypothetical protein